MVNKEHVESVAASLVREYLSRKGLVCSLQSMDTELPRTDSSISNRAQLAREIHIEKLLKKNKEQVEPLRSMVEIITKHFLDKSTFNRKDTVHAHQTTASAKNTSHSRAVTGGMKEFQNKGSTNSATCIHAKLSVAQNNELEVGFPQEDVGGLYFHNHNSTPVITMQEKPDIKDVEYYTESVERLVPGKPSFVNTGDINGMNNKHESRSGVPASSMSRNGGIGGPICTSSIDNHEKRRIKKSLSPNGRDSSLGLNPEVTDRSSSENRNRLKDLGFTFTSPPNTTKEGDNESSQKRPNSKTTRSLHEDVSKVIQERSNSERRPDSGIYLKEKLEPNVKGATANQRTLGDAELGHLDDVENDKDILLVGPRKTVNAVDSNPITEQQAVEIKNLLFGSSLKSFNNEWRIQGLTLNDIKDLEFGIVQHKGGPCGALAAIQSCMLQRLLFGDNKTASLQSSLQERNKCLAQALGDIVWRAGQKKRAVIALPTSGPQFTLSARYKQDGFTENLVLHHFKNQEDLEEFLLANIGVFKSDTSSGCILTLYSTILSKTVAKIVEDMDEPTNTLIGVHGYCTQEMVNLILTGRAVSNVFNDVMELNTGKESMILRGVACRSDIGLLSLFEHYGSCRVGSNYKTPRYPIWLVCSESHFSVLFCLKRELLNDWKVERHFDLYYYDGLSRQQELIKLSIDTTKSCLEYTEDDLIPPLEHCIRTKWPDAVVNWNGTEAIL